MINGYLLALLVLLAWIAFILFLRQRKLLEKYHMSLWGPFIMWRTQGGKRIIERLSRSERLWLIYAKVSLVIVFLAMASMFGLLLWEAALVDRIPADQAPAPEMLLGIPGLNPLIPIWYGIIGLVVAIIVHEFAHGILTRVGKMDIKALGLVFLVFPMGAFVEPDEEALVKAEKKKRMNVFAVGPATNIIVALVCALIFSQVMVASAEPVNQGIVVTGVADGSPLEVVDRGYGFQILTLEGVEYITIAAWQNASVSKQPGEAVTISYFYEGDYGNTTVVTGVVLTAVSTGYPAHDAGLRSGMIISSLNDTVIYNDHDLKVILAATVPGQKVNVTALQYDEDSGIFEDVAGLSQVTLASKRQYYEDNGITIPDDFQEMGFMGINSAYLGASVSTPEDIIVDLAHPYQGVDDVGSFVSSSLRYIALPFLGLAPVSSPLTDLYEPTGISAWLPNDIFWILANCFYWIFWINLMVGLTNALPAVPLDGGYLFKDALDGLIAKVKKGATQEQRDRIVSQITYMLAFFILFLILWQLIGPRLLG